MDPPLAPLHPVLLHLLHVLLRVLIVLLCRSPETQECIQAKPFDELGQFCSDDPACTAFMLKPGAACAAASPPAMTVWPALSPRLYLLPRLFLLLLLLLLLLPPPGGWLPACLLARRPPCCSLPWAVLPHPCTTAGGLLDQPYDIGIFKNESLPENIVFNPTAYLYIKNMQEPGGLSAGAIAGIAVASVAAGVALAAATWLLLRRWRRRRARRLASPMATPKALEVGLAAAGGGASAPPSQQAQAQAAAADRRFVRCSAGGNIPPSPFSSVDAGDAAFDGESGRMRAFVRSGSDGGTGLRVAVTGSPRTGPQLPLGGNITVGSAATSAQAARVGAGAAMAAATASPEGSVVMVSSPQHLQYPQYHHQQQGSWHSGHPSTASLSPSPTTTSTPTTTSIGAVGGGGSGRGSIVGQLGAAPGAPDATPLAELVEHVAQQDAVAGLGSGPTDGLPVSHHAMLAGALPAGLLEWVVDPEAVSYLRWPNGTLKELGRGAR